jgi:hypothetical protein
VKTFFKSSFLLVLLAAGAAAFGQATNSSTNQPAQIQSTFVMPTNPHEGRDPFFPESSRPYQSAIATHVAEVTTLTIKGFSGAGENRMVIINNHTFGVGDEGDVLTPSGRVHVRCLAINPDGVVIEANSQRRELSFSPQ